MISILKEITMKTNISAWFTFLIVVALAVNTWGDPNQPSLGADENLVAWAFLNYEPEGRSPEERAQMLQRLGFTKCGYEGHPHLIGQLEEHIIAYRKYNIELIGIYLEIRQANPLEQDYIMKAIEVFERQKCKLQLWLTVKETLFKDVPESQRAQKACDYIRPLAEMLQPFGVNAKP